MRVLLGVRYIVSPRGAVSFRRALEEVQQGWRSVLTSADGDYVVDERSEPLPRAYVAHAVRRAAGADEALRAVAAPEFDPWMSVVLEGEVMAASGEGRGLGIRNAIIEAYGPRRVAVVTDDSEPGYLILTDTFYPGWSADVDGRPAPILRANYLFRAVPVPSGTHRVTFTYEPMSLTLGLAVSGAAGILLALGLFRRQE